MILFDTDIGGNGNDETMNDFVILPPGPDACLMGRIDEYSYANLYDCYNAHNQSFSPTSTPLINGARDGKPIDVAANITAAAFSSASVQSPSLVSPCSLLLASGSDSEESFRNITDSIPPNSRTNNDEDNNVSKTMTKTSAAIITRDPRNGAFTFQVHAEFDLLLHVKKDLFLLDNQRNVGCIRLSEHIMHSIDEYCLKKQWMYHIGSEKGTAVSRFLRSKLEMWHNENVINSRNGASGIEMDKKTPKFVCVELGTYCGYSALVLAVTIHQFLQELQHQVPQRLSSLSLTPDDRNCETHVADVRRTFPFEFHIYTTEVSTKLLHVAQSIFRLSKMEHCITPVLVKEEFDPSNYENTNGNDTAKITINGSDGDDRDNFNNDDIHATHDINDHEANESSAESLSRTLKQQYNVSKIDFLLLDHAKHMYLRDLQTLERSGLVGKGSFVSADNVVFNRLDAYRDHMRQLESIGVVETRLEEMCLEYSNNLKDGIEMTVYRTDSPVVTSIKAGKCD